MTGGAVAVHLDKSVKRFLHLAMGCQTCHMRAMQSCHQTVEEVPERNHNHERM